MLVPLGSTAAALQRNTVLEYISSGAAALTHPHNRSKVW